MDAERARKHLLLYKKVLDSLNVKFWLACGTLLGAVRDQQFILWDHDIDTRLLAKDWSGKIQEELNKAGFWCKEWKLFGRIEKAQVGRFKIHHCIFIEHYYPPENVYIHFSRRLTHNWLEFPILAEELDLDCFVKFLGTRFRVPHNPEKYLERIYDKKWKKPLRHSWTKWPSEERSLEKYFDWFKENPDVP